MRVDVIIQLNYQAVILFDNMNKISQLSISKQTVVISSIITIIAFLTSTFCFFLGWFDIPLGILFGGFISTIPYVLFAYKEDTMSPNRNIKYTIVVIIIMTLLHILALVISCVLTYIVHIKLFNVFATFGGIFIGLTSNIIANILDGRRKHG